LPTPSLLFIAPARNLKKLEAWKELEAWKKLQARQNWKSVFRKAAGLDPTDRAQASSERGDASWNKIVKLYRIGGMTS
jgi:hypothetical protein